MRRLERTCMLMFVLATVSGCLLEPFTGSDLTVELGTGTFNSGDIINRSSEHYELFAVLNGGVVSVGKFRVDDRLDAYSVPAGDHIGVANHQGASLPLSGIAFHTEVHLDEADEILLSVEDNGETDAAPNGPVVARATLGDGPGGTRRGDLKGEVITIDDRRSPLVDSRVTIISSE